MHVSVDREKDRKPVSPWFTYAGFGPYGLAMEVEGSSLVLDTFGDVNETTAEWGEYYRMLYGVRTLGKMVW